MKKNSETVKQKLDTSAEFITVRNEMKIMWFVKTFSTALEYYKQKFYSS